MNNYLLVILASLIGGMTLSVYLELLNIRSLTPQIPDAFTDVFDQEKYLQSQAYAKAQARADIIHQLTSSGALIVFILASGFAWVHDLSLAVSHPILQGLLFLAVLFGLSEILNLPFSLYRTFVLEAAFGFNKTTLRTYLADKFKSYLLVCALGGPLITAILWLFQQAGAYAWMWCWLVMTLFSLALTYLAPTFIFPLFNTFTPLEPSELRARLEAMAVETNFCLTDISVMDGSKRSSKSNAFFTGLGKRKRIALYDTLIANHTSDEIAAVLAHEIGHYRCGHITKGFVLSTLHTGALLFLMSFFLNSAGLFQAFGLQAMPIHAGLVFFTLLFTPLSLVLAPLFAHFSRKHEFEADRFAASSLHTSKPMIAALKKLATDNLSNVTPHPWYVFFHYSHPPLLARIRALQHLENSNDFFG